MNGTLSTYLALCADLKSSPSTVPGRSSVLSPNVVIISSKRSLLFIIPLRIWDWAATTVRYEYMSYSKGEHINMKMFHLKSGWLPLCLFCPAYTPENAFNFCQKQNWSGGVWISFINVSFADWWGTELLKTMGKLLKREFDFPSSLRGFLQWSWWCWRVMEPNLYRLIIK